MTRRAYLHLWNKQHPGYKAAHERRRVLFRPAKHAVYREILGVRVMVNLIPLVKKTVRPVTFDRSLLS